MRVNAQLIDARTDAHQWAENFDRDIADVFAIQSEIAKAIADQLQAKLSPSEKTAIEQKPTSDVTAFDLYNRAKNILLTTSLNANVQSSICKRSIFSIRQSRATRHFSKLIASWLTPMTISTSSGTITLRRGSLWPRRRSNRPFVCVLMPVNRTSRAPKIFIAVISILMVPSPNSRPAKKTLPNDSRVPELTGYIVRRQGKQDEAVKYLQRALELDPRNFFIFEQIALSYQNLRRYPEMAAMLDRGLAIKPGDVEIRASRALVDLDWKADPQPLHQMLRR